MARRPTRREALWVVAMVYAVVALVVVAFSQSWLTLLFVAPLAVYGIVDLVREVAGYPSAVARFVRRRR